MEVRKKRPRGFKKEAQGFQVSPLNPLYVAPWVKPDQRELLLLDDPGERDRRQRGQDGRPPEQRRAVAPHPPEIARAGSHAGSLPGISHRVQDHLPEVALDSESAQMGYSLLWGAAL